VLRTFDAAVNVSSAFDTMRGVALLLQAPKNGADGGVLHGTDGGKGLAHLLGIGGTMRPEVLHHDVLELAKRFAVRFWFVTHCNVTCCNIRGKPCQAFFVRYIGRECSSPILTTISPKHGSRRRRWKIARLHACSCF